MCVCVCVCCACVPVCVFVCVIAAAGVFLESFLVLFFCISFFIILYFKKGKATSVALG